MRGPQDRPAACTLWVKEPGGLSLGPTHLLYSLGLDGLMNNKKVPQPAQARPGYSDLKSATVVQFNELKDGNELSSWARAFPQGKKLQLRALVWVLHQLYLRGSQSPAQEHWGAL